MNEWIKVDVGGKIFQTTRETLLLIPYFQGLNRFNNLDSSSEIKIDQDPTAFKHILRCMRTPTYQIPPKFYQCLDFWGLPELKRTPHQFDMEPCKNFLNRPNIIKECPYWENFNINLRSGETTKVKFVHEGIKMDTIKFEFPRGYKFFRFLKVQFLDKDDKVVFSSKITESIWRSYRTRNNHERRIYLLPCFMDLFKGKEISSIVFQLSKTSEITDTSFIGRIIYDLDFSDPDVWSSRYFTTTPSFKKCAITDGVSDLSVEMSSLIKSDWCPSKIKIFFLTKKFLSLFACKTTNATNATNELMFQLDLKYRDQSPLKLDFTFDEEFKNCKVFIEPKLSIKYYLIVYYDRKSKR